MADNNNSGACNETHTKKTILFRLWRFSTVFLMGKGVSTSFLRLVEDENVTLGAISPIFYTPKNTSVVLVRLLKLEHTSQSDIKNL